MADRLSYSLPQDHEQMYANDPQHNNWPTCGLGFMLRQFITGLG